MFKQFSKLYIEVYADHIKLFLIFQVLWPYLLQFLIPVDFTPALMPVCKALGSIAAHKWEEDDAKYNISYMENGMV